MKITVARIRSNVRYNKPLQTVLDSFFENYVRWMQDNPQHEYDTYNLSFARYSRPMRTPETIKWADVIVIPSDSEFRYHGDLQMNPKDLAKSQEHIRDILPYIKDKHIIVWRSDRGDTEQLYREETFQNTPIKSYTEIDETDFSGNIHGMKYHFITKAFSQSLFQQPKTVEFGYWGKMKKGCDRGKVLRKIYRDPRISNVFVGGFPSGIERQSAWIKDWYKLYPLLEPCKFTLCFNWKDDTATTARYPEALALGMIPFVWQNYDKNNTYNIEPEQRITDFDDLKDKINLLNNDHGFAFWRKKILNNYKKVLLSPDQYYTEFSRKMRNALL